MLEEAAQTGLVDDGSSSNITDQIRITAFLIHDQQLWIGTSTGIIFVLNFTFQQKSTRTSSVCSTNKSYGPRSSSVTNHMINGMTRDYLSLLPTIVNNRRKSRSKSESAMVDIVNSSDEYWDGHYTSSHHQLYRIRFSNQMKYHSTHVYRHRKRRSLNGDYQLTMDDYRHRNTADSEDSTTTLASTKAPTSSPAVISSDELAHKRPPIKFPSTIMKQQKSQETSSTLSFNLLFKAKIADAPVKCICKTKYIN